MNKRLILASQSPRRRELLTLLEMPFSVVSPDGDETLNDSLDPRGKIEELALRKAQSVFKDHNDSIVVGADTVVVVDGEIVGKPIDEDDAVRMLKVLSGREHQVITGVAILSDSHQEVFSITTEVKFFNLDDNIIESYVASKEPLDKAGSYGIQGRGSLFVESIVGDYYTVMGLPISQVHQKLIHNNW